jgi:hypothetical protein
MVAGWQQLVLRGRRSEWRCECAELVAGGAWSETNCCAGIRQGYMGSVPRTKQKTELAAIGAGEETARASRSTVTSGRSQRSGWIEAVQRVSACWGGCDDMLRWQISSAEILTSSSVSRWNGQNISSSSISKDLAASKSRLNASMVGGSTLNSFGVRTWRICLWCWAATRGARRDRPPWWLCVWALRCCCWCWPP